MQEDDNLVQSEIEKSPEINRLERTFSTFSLLELDQVSAGSTTLQVIELNSQTTVTTFCVPSSQLDHRHPMDEPQPDELVKHNLRPRRSICYEDPDSKLRQIKHRTISRPAKHIRGSRSVKGTQKEIENLYVNQKLLKSFRPTNLETIMENTEEHLSADDSIAMDDDSKQFVYFGNRRIKRSLSFHDGRRLASTAPLLKRRRRKIRAINLPKGGAKMKKIPMELFMKRLEEIPEDDCSNNEPCTSGGFSENTVNNIS